MATTEAPRAHPMHAMLPKLGSAEEFAALGRLLAECGYDNAGICRRLQIDSIVDFKAICDGRTTAREIEQPLDVLIRLLLDGEFVPDPVVKSMLPPGGFEALRALDLIEQIAVRPGEWFSPIVIYPAAQGLLLTGDRPGTPDGSPYWTPPDIVYPGVVENTRNFLAALPATPCEALLDLGTGSGVAALAASGYARHAWGADIAARAVRFAEFSRRLNGIENVTMAEGDMYDAIGNLTFDRIITHPPYVPSPKTEVIFRDGGEDGEQILRRAIEGLPAHLRAEGRFYTLVLGADLKDEPFEARIRKWLGAAEAEFDLVMVSHSLRPPAEFAANSLASGKGDPETLKFCRELWARRGVQFLFYGSILIRRHGGNRTAVTARAQKGEGFRPEHQEWLLDWESECRAPQAAVFLMDAHPSIAPAAELHVLHRLREGRFAPEAFAIEAKAPFVSELRCPGWMAGLISRCDGIQSWGQHFAAARQEKLIDPDTPAEEFAALLGMLVGQGILRIRERPFPSDVPKE